MKIRNLAAALALVLIGSMCQDSSNEEIIGVENDSPARQNVEVFYLIDGEERLMVEVPPGSSVRLRNAITRRCTEGILIARYLDGEEVERRGPGVCAGRPGESTATHRTRASCLPLSQSVYGHGFITRRFG